MPDVSRKVWTYWDARPLPIEVKEAIASWRKCLPGYEITVLDDSSVAGVAPPTYSQLVPAAKSDVVRCHALATNGGIWMDATITLRDGLDWIFSSNPSAILYAFQFPNILHIENWFLAVRGEEGRRLMAMWRDSFYRIVAHWPNVENFYGPARTHNPRYFMMYEAFAHLVMRDPSFQRLRKKVHAMDARIYMARPDGWAGSDTRLVKYTKGGRRFRRRMRYVMNIAPIVVVVLLLVAWRRRLYPRRVESRARILARLE